MVKVRPPRTMNPMNAQTTRLFINSEGDAIVNGDHTPKWKPQNEQEKLCEDTWGKLMGHFRNWSRSRSGGAFSDTKDACWLPNACIDTEGQVHGLLSTELSSKESTFMQRPDSPPKELLEPAIDKLIRGLGPINGLRVAKREYEPGYFEIDVTFPPANLDQAVKLCLVIAHTIAQDPVLAQAREWIG